MSSDHRNIRIALETAVNAMSPSLATVFENAEYTPIEGTPYQQVSILFADPSNVEYGSNHQELGYMQVKLMYPLLVGVANIEARTALLRTTFRRGASFSNGGIVTVVSKTPSISPGRRDGDRWAVPVIIRFYANIGL